MDFRRIDPASARIVLIEAGPRIMPTLPENLSDYVRRRLAKKGVEVMTSTRVMSCDAHGVELEHGGSMPTPSSGLPAWWPLRRRVGSMQSTIAPGG